LSDSLKKTESTKCRSSPESIVKFLSADLRLTMAYLQVYPKVYWIWTHRRWCLENAPPGPDNTKKWRNDFWKMELMVIEKLLDADARNCKRSCCFALAQSDCMCAVHAWSYRSYVISSLPSSFTPPKTPAEELRYTKKKIEANFSNFSAWHFRTKILGKRWKGMEEAEVERQKDEGVYSLCGERLRAPADRGQNLNWLDRLCGQIPRIRADGCTTSG
jgi:geranylgeranyl transferase type-2 subunit alpha